MFMTNRILTYKVSKNGGTRLKPETRDGMLEKVPIGMFSVSFGMLKEDWVEDHRQAGMHYA